MTNIAPRSRINAHAERMLSDFTVDELRKSIAAHDNDIDDLILNMIDDDDDIDADIYDDHWGVLAHTLRSMINIMLLPS